MVVLPTPPWPCVATDDSRPATDDTATAPELVTKPGVALNYVGFNGILTGLFIGWRLHTFYVYRMGPTEDLTIADVEASPTDA